MSIRREALADTTNLTANRVGGTRVAEAIGVAQSPLTISDRLGIERQTAPPSWPPAFEPQYREVEEVGNVVDLFDEFDDVEATGGVFGKKKPDAAGVKPQGGIIANLKAAKKKANSAVLNAAKGAKSFTKGANDALSGLSHFDYKVYSDAFTAILGVAKKGEDGKKVDDKYNYKAFAGDSKFKKVLAIAQAQEIPMTRTESKTKNTKGRESKVIGRKIKGRNAACLGFAEVEASEENQQRYGEVIFPPAAAAGVPTLVTLTPNDSNGRASMRPITGLVVEVLDTEVLAFADDKIAINMEEVKETGTPASKATMTSDEFEFEYSLCVHGIHVDEDKALHMGPRIIVPTQKMNDVTAYGIATENGIESALAHAIKGEKLDLLLLWTSFKLVQGARGLASKSLGGKQKAAIAELFGSMDSAGESNTIGDDYDEDEFGDVNRANLPLED